MEAKRCVASTADTLAVSHIIMGNIFSTLWETARVSAVEATHLFASKRLLMMCQQQNTKSHGIRRYRTVSTEHRKYDQLPQVQADTPKNANDTIPKQTCMPPTASATGHAGNIILWNDDFSGCFDRWSSR